MSDVIAGYAVGGFWVLILLALYPPEPQPGAELTSRQGGLQGVFAADDEDEPP